MSRPRHRSEVPRQLKQFCGHWFYSQSKSDERVMFVKHLLINGNVYQFLYGCDTTYDGIYLIHKADFSVYSECGRRKKFRMNVINCELFRGAFETADFLIYALDSQFINFSEYVVFQNMSCLSLHKLTAKMPELLLC